MEDKSVDFGDAKVFTQGDVVDKETGEVISVDAIQLDRLTRSEIDVQIATAHRFPRSISKFLTEAEEMATIDEETAESCIYNLPRADDLIPGPSIRLAEIVGSAWQNLRYGSRIIGEDGDFIVAQGICHDLEKNIAATVDVRRRIVNKHGRRYSVDMIGVTGMAAASIAIRNAILRVVPRAYINKIYKKARFVAVGDATTLSERRQKAVSYFTQTLGVKLERFLAKLEREGIEDITLEDLEKLTGLKTAIKEKDVSVDETFPPLEEKKNYTGSDAAVTPETEPKKEPEQKPDKKKSRPKKGEEELNDKPGDMDKESLDADINKESEQPSFLND